MGKNKSKKGGKKPKGIVPPHSSGEATVQPSSAHQKEEEQQKQQQQQQEEGQQEDEGEQQQEDEPQEEEQQQQQQQDEEQEEQQQQQDEEQQHQGEAEQQQQEKLQQWKQQQDKELEWVALKKKQIHEFQNPTTTAEEIAARPKLNPRSRRGAAKAATSSADAKSGDSTTHSAAPISEEAGKRDFHFFAATGRSAPATQQPFYFPTSKADDDYRMALDEEKLRKAIRGAERKTEEKYHNILTEHEARYDQLADEFERGQTDLKTVREELRGAKEAIVGYERDMTEVKQKQDGQQEIVERLVKFQTEWKAERKELINTVEAQKRQLDQVISSCREANKRVQQAELANRSLNEQLDEQRKRADAATILAEEGKAAEAELQQVNASLEEMFQGLGENLTAQDYINHVRDITSRPRRRESVERESERGRIVSGSSMQDELARSGWGEDAESESSESPLDDLRMIELEAERDEAQEALKAAQEAGEKEKATAESLKTELARLQQEVQAGEVARERVQAEAEALKTEVRHLQQGMEAVEAARKRGEARAASMEKEWRKAVNDGEAKADRIRRAGTERVVALEEELAKAQHQGGEELSTSASSEVEATSTSIPTHNLESFEIPGVLEIWGESPWYLKAMFFSAIGLYLSVVLALFLEYCVWRGANDITRQRILAISPPFATAATSELAMVIGEKLGVDFTILG